MRDFLLVVCIVAACLSQLMWCMSDKSDAVCQRIIKVELHYDMLSKLRWSPLTVESLNAAESSAKQNATWTAEFSISVEILCMTLRVAQGHHQK